MNVLFYKLSQKVADINARSWTGDTAIDLAVKGQNWGLVKLLVEGGAAWYEIDDEGYDSGCMHETKGSSGNTPLHLAVQHQNWAVAKELVQCGAEVNELDLEDPQGNTALQIAAKRRLIYIVDCLIDKAENPNAKDSDGFTLLLRLSQMPSKSCFSHCYDLQKKGVDINTCTTNGESALHLAVKSNNWPMVHFLLNRGALFNVQDLEQMYTIHRLIKCSTSAYCGSDELRLMTLLTDMGLSIAMPDSCGRTPAELAFKHKKWKLLKYLLELGAQLNPTPSKGNSLFHELAKLDFIKKEAAEVTHLIVNHVSGINLKNNVGDTPVHVALNEDNWDVVKAFVEHGADPNILDRKGQCLLHKFVTNLNQKIVFPL
ncbi:uncharacterized protein LOC112558717 [Pomacea canaliculata]|uniref:uncharacterized protein LOC112558717 n=1 Tax=Pomacea canaliculata TaxID=400727 RepID=UPI000D738A21|nr:uncharacterized protein LOC112558717 [Pomacea canaliculata]